MPAELSESGAENDPKPLFGNDPKWKLSADQRSENDCQKDKEGQPEDIADAEKGSVLRQIKGTAKYGQSETEVGEKRDDLKSQRNKGINCGKEKTA